MSDKAKVIITAISAVLGTILLFCLVVSIGCAINGLTFGQQISSWFGSNAGTVGEVVQEVAETVAETPVA